MVIIFNKYIDLSYSIHEAFLASLHCMPSCDQVTNQSFHISVENKGDPCIPKTYLNCSYLNWD